MATDDREPTTEGVDPAVLLLVQEIRRSNDSLRKELVAANKEIVAAHREAITEIRLLRDVTPGRLNQALALGIVLLALFALAGLITVAGGDVRGAAEATHTVATGIVSPASASAEANE